MLSLGLWRIESEGGGDQRREGLDVGAHHDDVPGLECGIVSEQANEHFPQHLHLTIRPVTGMELHTAVIVNPRRGRSSNGRIGQFAAMSDCSQPSKVCWLGSRAP